MLPLVSLLAFSASFSFSSAYDLSPRDTCSCLSQGAATFANSAAVIEASDKATTPSGYLNTGSNGQSWSPGEGCLGFVDVDDYDSTVCAGLCDTILECSSFQIYFEKNQSGEQQVKCTFWGGVVDSSNTNYNISNAIAGCNTYTSNKVVPPSGFDKPKWYGNSAFDYSGPAASSLYVGSKVYDDASYDTSRCAEHMKSLGGAFYNTYFVHDDDASNQHCDVYSGQVPDSAATWTGKPGSKGNSSISNSFAYGQPKDSDKLSSGGSWYNWGPKASASTPVKVVTTSEYPSNTTPVHSQPTNAGFPEGFYTTTSSPSEAEPTTTLGHEPHFPYNSFPNTSTTTTTYSGSSSSSVTTTSGTTTSSAIGTPTSHPGASNSKSFYIQLSDASLRRRYAEVDDATYVGFVNGSDAATLVTVNPASFYFDEEKYLRYDSSYIDTETSAGFVTFRKVTAKPVTVPKFNLAADGTLSLDQASFCATAANLFITFTSSPNNCNVVNAKVSSGNSYPAGTTHGSFPGASSTTSGSTTWSTLPVPINPHTSTSTSSDITSTTSSTSFHGIPSYTTSSTGTVPTTSTTSTTSSVSTTSATSTTSTTSSVSTSSTTSTASATSTTSSVSTTSATSTTSTTSSVSTSSTTSTSSATLTTSTTSSVSTSTTSTTSATSTTSTTSATSTSSTTSTTSATSTASTTSSTSATSSTSTTSDTSTSSTTSSTSATSTSSTTSSTSATSTTSTTSSVSTTSTTWTTSASSTTSSVSTTSATWTTSSASSTSSSTSDSTTISTTGNNPQPTSSTTTDGVILPSSSTTTSPVDSAHGPSFTIPGFSSFSFSIPNFPTSGFPYGPSFSTSHEQYFTTTSSSSTTTPAVYGPTSGTTASTSQTADFTLGNPAFATTTTTGVAAIPTSTTSSTFMGSSSTTTSTVTTWLATTTDQSQAGQPYQTAYFGFSFGTHKRSEDGVKYLKVSGGAIVLVDTKADATALVVTTRGYLIGDGLYFGVDTNVEYSSLHLYTWEQCKTAICKQWSISGGGFDLVSTGFTSGSASFYISDTGELVTPVQARQSPAGNYASANRVAATKMPSSTTATQSTSSTTWSSITTTSSTSSTITASTTTSTTTSTVTSSTTTSSATTSSTTTSSTTTSSTTTSSTTTSSTTESSSTSSSTTTSSATTSSSTTSSTTESSSTSSTTSTTISSTTQTASTSTTSITTSSAIVTTTTSTSSVTTSYAAINTTSPVVVPYSNSTAPTYNSTAPAYNTTVLPTNDTHAGFNGTLPSLNGTVPSFNGTVPPFFNGTVPPFNGTVPSFNGTVPSFNGTVSPFNISSAHNLTEWETWNLTDASQLPSYQAAAVIKAMNLTGFCSTLLGYTTPVTTQFVPVTVTARETHTVTDGILTTGTTETWTTAPTTITITESDANWQRLARRTVGGPLSTPVPLANFSSDALSTACSWKATPVSVTSTILITTTGTSTSTIFVTVPSSTVPAATETLTAFSTLTINTCQPTAPVQLMKNPSFECYKAGWDLDYTGATLYWGPAGVPESEVDATALSYINAVSSAANVSQAAGGAPNNGSASGGASAPLGGSQAAGSSQGGQTSRRVKRQDDSKYYAQDPSLYTPLEPGYDGSTYVRLSPAWADGSSAGLGQNIDNLDAGDYWMSYRYRVPTYALNSDSCAITVYINGIPAQGPSTPSISYETDGWQRAGGFFTVPSDKSGQSYLWVDFYCPPVGKVKRSTPAEPSADDWVAPDPSIPLIDLDYIRMGKDDGGWAQYRGGQPDEGDAKAAAVAADVANAPAVAAQYTSTTGSADYGVSSSQPQQGSS